MSGQQRCQLRSGVAVWMLEKQQLRALSIHRSYWHFRSTSQTALKNLSRDKRKNAIPAVGKSFWRGSLLTANCSKLLRYCDHLRKSPAPIKENRDDSQTQKFTHQRTQPVCLRTSHRLYPSHHAVRSIGQKPWRC